MWSLKTGELQTKIYFWGSERSISSKVVLTTGSTVRYQAGQAPCKSTKLLKIFDELYAGLTQ